MVGDPRESTSQGMGGGRVIFVLDIKHRSRGGQPPPIPGEPIRRTGYLKPQGSRSPSSCGIDGGWVSCQGRSAVLGFSPGLPLPVYWGAGTQLPFGAELPAHLFGGFRAGAQGIADGADHERLSLTSRAAWANFSRSPFGEHGGTSGQCGALIGKGSFCSGDFGLSHAPKYANFPESGPQPDRLSSRLFRFGKLQLDGCSPFGGQLAEDEYCSSGIHGFGPLHYQRMVTLILRENG